MGALGILFVAIGAVLAFAVDFDVEGVDLETVGLILMVAGGIGVTVAAVRGTFWGVTTRHERVVSDDGRHVVEESRTNGR